MESVYTISDQQMTGLSSLADFGLDQDNLNRIDDAIREAAGNLKFLSPSQTRDANFSFPVSSLFITEPLHTVTDLNRLFKSAFEQVQGGGFLICHLETTEQRKRRLMNELPVGINHLRYAGDFLLHRVSSRVVLTRPVYRMVFPCIRTISKAEAFGRLFYAGFTVKTSFDSRNSLVIIAQKTANEFTALPPSSEGVLLRIRRIGLEKRLFNVYKFRTMHPYSEYLQQYLMETTGLDTSGKFKDDFRVTSLGKWMRKYKVDELP
ncbi:MAG: hypothetical protein EOO01_11710, partial [Chitinophagaceae bacterium]